MQTLEQKRKEVLEKNPKAFRTATQGVEGNFWFYQAYTKGNDFMFRVDMKSVENPENFQKQMDSVDLLDFLVEG